MEFNSLPDRAVLVVFNNEDKVDINNPVPIVGGRQALFSVGEKNFPSAGGLLRMALLFQFEQLSLTSASTMADGEPREDREVIINKRRGAFKMLEMLDGVLYPSPGFPNPVLVIINGTELSKDCVDVLRQALMATKQYKVRDSATSQLINEIVAALNAREEPEAKSA